MHVPPLHPGEAVMAPLESAVALWLPNLLAAIVLLVGGGFAAKALANLARVSAAASGFRNPETIARGTRIAVWAFAIIAAADQLGIAPLLLTALFTAIIGAAALALGLAFGLGGRETAAEIIRRAYARSQDAPPHLAQAVESYAAREQQRREDRRREVQPTRRSGDALGD